MTESDQGRPGAGPEERQAGSEEPETTPKDRKSEPTDEAPKPAKPVAPDDGGAKPTKPPRKKRSLAFRIGRALVSILLGLSVGLALSECIFYRRDEGAFPHLNVYVADPELGVRLRPGATERVRFSDNPITTVRINKQGYRGADWPEPGDDDILVVGDSQAFGLGVEEDETFAARLAKELEHAVVLNAGVPTYGPVEYKKLLEELLPKRKPKTVVYVVNFVNDPFEAKRSNAGRHIVWDGWAVRRETAPSTITQFPGRDFLYRRSHAFFALRQYFFNRKSLAILRVPSEGDATDLLDEARAAEESEKWAREETIRRAHDLDAETRAAQLMQINADQRVKAIALREGHLGESSSVYLASNATPGDIVVPQLGEEGSPLGATAKYVREAALLREKIERELREKALKDAASESSKATLDAFDRRDELEKKLKRLHAAPIEVVRTTEPMIETVMEAKALVESHGARFVLLALPMDVQVSRDEWRKYFAEESIDMEPTLVLVKDLVQAVRENGGVAVDPTEALRQKKTGMFLKGDPHLSPKGHDVVAKVLAEGMLHPPKPKPQPMLGLPEGRSRVPKPSDWPKVGDLLVAGSDAEGCKTQRIREWMLIRCKRKEHGAMGKPAPMPQAVRVLRGGHGDAITLVTDDVITLIAPVLRGDTFQARFSWEDHAKTITIEWPADVVEVELALQKDDGAPDPRPDVPLPKLAACLEKKSRKMIDFIGYPDAACEQSFASDCDRMIACAEGDPAFSPTCGDGETNAGAALRCHRLCETDADCKGGRCSAEYGKEKVCTTP